jgi:hypothetical protein
MLLLISRSLDQINQRLGSLATTVPLMEKRLMTAIDDLNAAIATLGGNVTTLTNNVAANDKAIQAEIAALQTALLGGNTTAIQAAIANISGLSGAIGTQAAAVAKETADLTASLPPAG